LMLLDRPVTHLSTLTRDTVALLVLPPDKTPWTTVRNTGLRWNARGG
jgi:hypothetical protein